MSLFCDCGWEKLGASVVSFSWSAALFRREQKHIFCWLGCQGQTAPSLLSTSPSAPQLLKLPMGTGTMHLDTVGRDG